MTLSILTLLVGGVAAAMMFAPTIAARRREGVPRVALLALLAVGAALVADPRTAFGLVSVAGLLHAAGVWSKSRTGARSLLLASLATGGAAVALSVGQPNAAFACSMLAIAVRSAVFPLHVGTVELCERAPEEQVRQLASLLPLVFVHVSFVSSTPLAHASARWLFVGGALASLLPGLAALAQADLKGLYRMTTMLHGGYVVCAAAAAAQQHPAAALFASLTLLLAVGGLGLLIVAIEARCGKVGLTSPGGRVTAFPHLAGAFAILGAGGVGLPATAGFVADDLLLHAAWEDGLLATAALIIASVALAVATLRGYARVFLGPPVRSVAPDLLFRERVVVVGIIVALIVLGVVPQFVISAAA